MRTIRGLLTNRATLFGGLFALLGLGTLKAWAQDNPSVAETLANHKMLPDVSITLNGVLAGLVAITAPCAFVSPLSAAIIGMLGGIVVVISVLLLGRVRVDDPVGAVSVHGLCGALGTLALGLFAQEGYAPANTTGNGLLFGGGLKLLTAQAIGAGAVFLRCVIAGVILFGLLKVTIGIRVSAEEIEGLNIGEHGMAAYPDFVLATPGQFSVTGGTRSPSAPAMFVTPPVPKPSSETSM